MKIKRNMDIEINPYNNTACSNQLEYNDTCRFVDDVFDMCVLFQEKLESDCDWDVLRCDKCRELFTKKDGNQ